MGNGSGIDNDDLEINDLFGVNIADPAVQKPLSVDDLNKATAAAMANFGSPTQIFLPPQAFFMMSALKWQAHPEYDGTPWADKDRLTKREHAVAKLHIFLYKLKTLRNTDETAFQEIYKQSIKRLKRAKWAQYGQPKVESSP